MNPVDLSNQLATRLSQLGPLAEPTQPAPPGPGLYAVTRENVTRLSIADPLWPAHPDPIEVCHALRLSVEATGRPMPPSPVQAVALYLADRDAPANRTLFAVTPDGHACTLRRIGDAPPVDQTLDPAAIGVIHHPLALLARAWAAAPAGELAPLPEVNHAEAVYARLLDAVTTIPAPGGTPTQAWWRVQASALRLHAIAVGDAVARAAEARAAAERDAVAELIKEAVLDRRIHLGDAQPLLAELGLPPMPAHYEVRLLAAVTVEVTASDSQNAIDEVKSQLEDRLAGDRMWLELDMTDVHHVSDPDPCS